MKSARRLGPLLRRTERFSPLLTFAGAAFLMIIMALLITSLSGPSERGQGAAASPHDDVPADSQSHDLAQGSRPVTTPSNNEQPAVTVAPFSEAPSSASTPDVTPTVVLNSSEVSDAYWTRVTDFGLYGQTYGSLEEIARDAHLIVRGQLTGFEFSIFRPFQEGPVGSSDLIVGIVRVDEVLKGEPVMREPGFIEVAELGWKEMSPEELPSDQAIFFLKNDARQRQELGYPPRDAENERYRYWRPNGYQCVLRIADGRISLVGPWESWQEITGDDFPGTVEGMSVDVVMTLINELQ